MYRTATFLALTLISVLALPSACPAATPEQRCRKDVDKNVTKFYTEVLKLSSKCFKNRIKTPGDTTDCLDPAAFDPRDKLGGKTAALVAAMGAQSSNCSTFGPQYTAACQDAPAACTAACTACTTGEEAAACIACQVTQLALTQTDALYGNPPDLSADKDAQKCQATIGKEASKYGRTRLKEQQKCQQAVGGNKLRANCTNADLKGKTARGGAKSSAKTVKKCLTSPGIDQVPDLDSGAVCLGADTATAASCAVATTDAVVDAVFALASKPAALRGVVMGMGPAGGLLPLPGVRIEITEASLGASTDNNGAYRLEGVPPGSQTIVIDGQRVGSYPRIPMGVSVPMVGEESLGIFTMPEIDMANAVDITSISTANPDGSRVLTSALTLANPTIPGATLDVQAGTLITFDVPNRAPLLSVSVVPFAVMPFPTGGVFSDQIFSFQPEGTTISPAAKLTLPNNTGLADGASVDIYIPDFATNTFINAGTGTVINGGTIVQSDAAVVNRFDWHFIATPPTGCITTVIGRVIDGASLLPVVGANVLVAGTTTVSGPLGTFAFPGLSCPPVVRVDASAVNPTTGATNTGSGTFPTTFFGTTDVGEIELLQNNCPNGVLDLGEDCDDGNQIAGDGCNPFCIEELCGNFVVDPGEECDGIVGCSDFCTFCGDGAVRTPGEECDAGAANGQVGRNCSSTCQTTVCGNGLLEETEECDFGSANGGALSFCQNDCRLKPATQGGGSSVVRAFGKCPSPSGTPNTVTSEGVPACQPPTTASAFEFGPSATGELNFGVSAGGADALISVSLGDVQDSAGVAITDATGWRLTAAVRVTLRMSATLPDVTMEDITVVAPLTLGAAGQLSGSASVATASGVNFSDFAQHNVQILDVAVIDPSGAEFADAGFLLDPMQSLSVNAPTQAKGGAVELARFFDACAAPTVAVGGGAANACSPPSAPSAWTFAATGNASFTYQIAGNDLSLAASMDGVLDPAMPALTSASILTVQRFTVREPLGEMTIIDFPLSVAVSLVAGKGVAKTTLSTIWTNLFGPGAAFPPSAQSSLTADIDPFGAGPTGNGMTPVIFDDAGNTFAQIGMRDTGP